MARLLLALLLLPCIVHSHEGPSLDGFIPGRLGNILAGSYFWHDVNEQPKLSRSADKLLRDSLKGIPYIVDAHMHLVGSQTELTGCHAHQTSVPSTLQAVKQRVLSAASGVKSISDADRTAAKRTVSLILNFPHRVPYYGALFAFSATYDLEKGTVDMSRTSLHVPNEYMLQVCSEAPERLIPVGSIHPYDANAIEKLRALKAKGVHLIKWLPNSQFISPSHSKSLAFLAEMAKLKMVLVTHVGDEHAVNAAGTNNQFGNPSVFRIALRENPDLHIIFAHVGSEGTSIVDNRKRENFDVVIDILKEFPKQAFADISAFSSAYRRVKYLPRLLAEKKIHGQLIYGTDYPLPAVGMLSFWTLKKMWYTKLLTFSQTSQIHEIFRHNPLAASFVAMRLVKYKGNSFPSEVFYNNFAKVFHKGHMPIQLPAN